MFKAFINALFIAFVLFFLPDISTADTKAVANGRKVKIERVAVVDIQMVLDNSSAIQSIRRTVNMISGNLQIQFENEKLSLKKQENYLLSLKSDMDELLFEKEANVFNNKVTAMQHEEKNQKLKLEQLHANALNIVNEAILKIINDIAFEQNLELILPSSQVLYASDTINITEEILTRLNTKLPSLSLTF